jgi:hypothetical protein
VTDEETVTWHHVAGRAGCALGGLAGLTAGTIAGVLAFVIFSTPSAWTLALVVLFIVAGAVLGVIAGRREVHTAQFTSEQVRLRSKLTSRTVRVADLTAVTVEHSGDTDSGYQQTSLRLALPDGSEVVLKDGYHPTLAGSLTQLVGPTIQVEEKWQPLEPPPSSA